MASVEKTEIFWHDVAEAPTRTDEYIVYDKYAGGACIYEYSVEDNRWLYYGYDEVDYSENYTDNVVCWAELPEIPDKYKAIARDL